MQRFIMNELKKDEIFSHKEVKVLYVPDLSDCLPSTDAWRDQWLSHKKAIAEREHRYALKREIARGKKEGLKDKEPGTPKDLKKARRGGMQRKSNNSRIASQMNIMSPPCLHDSISISLMAAAASTSEAQGLGMEEFHGCTLLHLACETADIWMIELLLQYGAAEMM
uniref:DBC1/CARP1 catalytically inactive NUDIX hydrolase domain-containing protein n=1 Tax=Lactuca sativa TaxID=4236 RepID=A0A9R1XS63_LACSA|nr:hypothetical protein LSAT_V11C100021710 [Lactuca sativa]